MKIISLRNLLSVAFLFNDANLLNMENVPTQEVVKKMPAMRHVANVKCLVFIFDYDVYTEKSRKFRYIIL